MTGRSARGRSWLLARVRRAATRGDECGDERGNAIVEFCYLGILFLVPLVYIMLAVFDVQRAAYGVSAATREAGRAYVLAPTNAQGLARAREAADYALRDQGMRLGQVRFNVRCDPANACGQSGSAAIVTIGYTVSFPFLPDVLKDARAATIPVTSIHRTPYGDYRQSRN
jgi:Flp pilus assembly protein TadG